MSEPVTLSPGSTVGGLRIDRVLGQGAFGVTYLVTDTALDRSFALKEFLPRDLAKREPGGALKLDGPEAGRRFAEGLAAFLEEGRTMARLEHKNVVNVVRCFEANNTAYLQMPSVRGETLLGLLKRGGAL